jgi:hypothetical protein
VGHREQKRRSWTKKRTKRTKEEVLDVTCTEYQREENAALQE